MPTITILNPPNKSDETAAGTNRPQDPNSPRARAMAILQGKVDPRKSSETATSTLPSAQTTQMQPQAPQSVIAPSTAESAPSPAPSSSTENTSVDTTAPKEEPLSPQYVQLAKKEAALRKAAVELKARQEAVAAREAALQAKAAPVQTPNQSLEERLKSSPDKVLEILSEIGIKYDNIVESATASPQELEAANKFKALEKRLEDIAKAQEKAVQDQKDAQTKAYDQAVKQIEHDAKALTKGNDSYELIEKTGSHQMVVELVKRVAQEENRMLSIQEASDLVEAELFESISAISSAKKIQEKFKPVAQPSSPAQQTQEVAPQQAKQPQTMKTLTNSVGAARPLTARERAIARFHGEKLE